MSPLVNEYFDLAFEHQQWLHSAGSSQTHWNNLLQNDPEAALSEAFVRRFLQWKNVTVKPGEGFGEIEGGPDFRCLSQGHEYFVEVTCIPKVKADEITDFGRGIHFHHMNEAIFDKCDAKASQCGKRRASVLLAISTFSSSARTAFDSPYSDMMVTGTYQHSVQIDTATMKTVGERKDSELRSSAFLCFDDEEGIVSARTSISGLLLCGPLDGIFVGVLNPFAAYPFPADVIPDFTFRTVEIDNEKLKLILKSTGSSSHNPETQC